MDPNASLANLRDIAVPEPPPFWPPAFGVWVLVIVVSVAVIALAIIVRRRWQDNAYRRAGLSLLKQSQNVRDVNIVLKRVALAVFPRSEVASLYGDEWTAFLDGNCRQTTFARLDTPDAEAEASHELQSLARTWIRRHRSPAVA